MKLYAELKYRLDSVDGKRTWVDPQPTGRSVSMEERHVEDINAQFENTGIRWAEDTPAIEAQKAGKNLPPKKGTEKADKPKGKKVLEADPEPGQQLGAGDSPADPITEKPTE